jgi:uroporphyrinogen-III synthase
VHVLVTRPAADGERTAAQLRARGCSVLLAPLLRIEPVEVELGGVSWGAIVVTSANAIHAIAHHPQLRRLLGLPVFAIGARTSEAARAVGFGNVRSADGSRDALVRMVGERCRDGPLILYLAGEDRAGDLAGDLEKAGVPARTFVVYRARAAAELPAPARDALSAGRIEGVLHFSPRSAAIFIDCAKAAGILDPALAPSALLPVAGGGAAAVLCRRARYPHCAPAAGGCVARSCRSLKPFRPPREAAICYSAANRQRAGHDHGPRSSFRAFGVGRAAPPAGDHRSCGDRSRR